MKAMINSQTQAKYIFATLADREMVKSAAQLLREAPEVHHSLDIEFPVAKYIFKLHDQIAYWIANWKMNCHLNYDHLPYFPPLLPYHWFYPLSDQKIHMGRLQWDRQLPLTFDSIFVVMYITNYPICVVPKGQVQLKGGKHLFWDLQILCILTYFSLSEKSILCVWAL